MKNSKPFVTIPQGSVCIPLSDVLFTNTELTDLRSIHCKMSQEIVQKDDLIAGQNGKIAELEAKVSELEQKNAELEKDVKGKGDSVLYWFNKYKALCNEREKEKSDAEAKTT